MKTCEKCNKEIPKQYSNNICMKCYGSGGLGIVGYGVVGKGMFNLFKNRFPVLLYDLEKYNSKEELDNCSLVIVCVPTNKKDDGSCDISIVEEVVSWIKSPLILIKSTVPPGTTEYLSKKYNKKICFSPEYMGESSYFTPFWKYPDPKDASSHSFVIIGGEEKTASQIMNYFMKVMSVDTNFAICSSKEAELTKYMENCFFATKVTFCNEFYNIAKAFNIEYKKLRELWLLDPRINRMHTAVFEDKKGFGGKCYPKDLSAIINASKLVGYEAEFLKEVEKTNERIKKSM